MIEPFQPSPSKASPQLLYLSSWMNDGNGLSAGFTTRNGGVSRSPWSNFNLALHVHDDEEAVIENRRIFMDSLGMQLQAFTCAEQVHSNTVKIVRAAHKGKGLLKKEDAIAGADGLLTDDKEICLVSFYADCVPLYFYDPVSQTIGLAHAGWKGTASKIAEKMIETLCTEWDAKPENIRAAIGPSIGSCCYEVSDDVAAHIREILPEDEVLKPNSNHRFMLDLKECNRQIMIRTGILSEHIVTTKHCTGCDTKLFFSHRKENGRTGRMASWIGWTKR